MPTTVPDLEKMFAVPVMQRFTVRVSIRLVTAWNCLATFLAEVASGVPVGAGSSAPGVCGSTSVLTLRPRQCALPACPPRFAQRWSDRPRVFLVIGIRRHWLRIEVVQPDVLQRVRREVQAGRELSGSGETIQSTCVNELMAFESLLVVGKGQRAHLRLVDQVFAPSRK